MSKKTLSYLALVAQKYARTNNIKLNDVSDYRISKELGVRPSAISNYRNGVSGLSDDMCIRVAVYLGITEALVLAEIMAERTKSPEASKAFKEAAKIIKVDFAKRAKAVAVSSMFVLAGVVGTPQKAIAAPFLNLAGSLQCILCKIAKRLLNRATRFAHIAHII